MGGQRSFTFGRTVGIPYASPNPNLTPPSGSGVYHRDIRERERRESMFADYYDYDSDDNCQFTNEGDSD